MARALDKNRSREVPTDRAIQYRDLDKTGQQASNRIMADRGRMADHVAGVVQQARENPGVSNDKRMRGLQHLEGQVENRNVTLKSASQNRVDLFSGGVARARNEGTDSGSGWYFGHHGRVAEVAASHGMSDRKLDVIEASALMSPQNSPENEVAAVRGHVARHAGAEYDQTDINRAGTKTNLKRSEGFLYEGGPGIPVTAPKIHSYSEAIKNAAPDTDIHREYQDRSAHVRDVLNGDQMKGQGRMDLWDKQESTEGILNPTGNTAEDTWMHTISLGQDLTKTVGKTNIAKTSSSDKRLGLVGQKTDDLGRTVHPSADVGPSQVQHAWNNEATIRAAAQIGEAAGLTSSSGESMVPSVLVQETAWTEARRVAGKDPAHRQAVREKEKSGRAEVRQQAADTKEWHETNKPLWSGADPETGLPKSGEYKPNKLTPRKKK